jgi:F-type H+-transporting ATPase subunit delta
LTTRAGVTPVLAKLLVLLAERDRLILLSDLLESYRDRLLDHEKVVRAQVTSAAPIEDGRLQDLERRLATVAGRRVALSARVDPSIIGGIVAHIGSTVYDGSVTRQLAKIRSRLVEGL